MSQRHHPYRPKRSHPPGFTLIELLVVMAIISVLATLMVAAVFRAMGVANDLKCTNHQRNLGLALIMYQDTRGYFPCEAESKESFYISLLDYVEAGYLLEPVRKQGPQAAEPVRAFLCPGRGRDVGVGAKGDYGYGSNPGNYSSILGSDKPVPISMVTAADGASNTLLLSHKGISPKHYNGSGPGDSGWAYRENSRDPDRILKDTDNEDMSKLIGSPHVLAAPSLFADGTVRKIPYDSSSQQIQGLPFMNVLWSYNDGKALGKLTP